jgi:hypothetical protein
MCARLVVAVPPVRCISSPFAATLAEQLVVTGLKQPQGPGT